jgi:ribosomal protein S18 acetylase RimI-like enzyme
MHIRLLSPADLDAYRDLRLSGIDESPTAFWASHAEENAQPLENMRQRLVATPYQVVFGGFVDGQLQALAGFRREAIAQIAHRGNIWGVYVAPQARGVGLGRLLLEALLAHVRTIPEVVQITLGVRSTNDAAKALYSKLGFIKTGADLRSICIDGDYHDEDRMLLLLDA